MNAFAAQPPLAADGRSGVVAAPAGRHNPLVDISPAARLMVLIYFVGWRMLPLVTTFRIDPDGDGLAAFALFAVRLASEALLVLPFVLRSVAGSPIGWLHPLVLPTLLVVAKDLVKDPTTLLLPVTVWAAAPGGTLAGHVALDGITPSRELAILLKQDSLFLLAQLAYLGGFAALVGDRGRPAAAARYGLSTPRMLIALAVCVAFFGWILSLSGGLVEHFSGLALGRFQMREGIGPLIILVNVAPYVAVAWYAHRPRLLVNPLFIALFIGTLAMQFATTGSRAGLVLPVAFLLSIRIYLSGRVPGLAAVAALAAIAVSLGALGELRGSAGRDDGTASLSLMSDIGVLAGAQKTIEEAQARQAESGLSAVMSRVPDEVPHLHGATYLSSVAFFVPRAIWPGKPRGSGAHAGALLFSGDRSAQGYEGTAFPVGGMGEAYWNFGMAGVAAVFALYGLFHRWLLNRMLGRPGDCFALLVYLLSLILLGDVDSESFVMFAQNVVLLWAVLRLARLRERAPLRHGAHPSRA